MDVDVMGRRLALAEQKLATFDRFVPMLEIMLPQYEKHLRDEAAHEQAIKDELIARLASLGIDREHGSSRCAAITGEESIEELHAKLEAANTGAAETEERRKGMLDEIRGMKGMPGVRAVDGTETTEQLESILTEARQAKAAAEDGQKRPGTDSASGASKGGERTGAPESQGSGVKSGEPRSREAILADLEPFRAVEGFPSLTGQETAGQLEEVLVAMRERVNKGAAAGGPADPTKPTV